MSLYSRYRTISDKHWLQLLAGEDALGNWSSGLAERFSSTGGWDAALPRLPDAQVQANFVGLSGRHALEEGLRFYRVVKRLCREFGLPISAKTRILDFGCGWGRVFRFFLKDVPADNLIGLDVDPEIIQVCRDTISEGRFEIVNPIPPAPLPDDSVDIIYAYSVLSHLAEDTHLRWVQEFARLLRTGGLVFATTQKRSFIEYCNGLTGEQIQTDWHRGLARSFRPLDIALARYDAGEFLYSPTGGGGARDASFYGEAAVSERYVDRHWPPRLTKRLFDQEILPQALIVAQKTS